MKPLISIIVPVYNVEQYLLQCLESLQSQTYENLEIILVDDGSTDKSGEMCDEYARNNPNTIVIHQENQGLSGARNTGMRRSSGEYISFLDSDDWLTSECIDYQYSLAQKYDADIVCTDFFTYWKGSGIVSDPEQGEFREILFSPEEALKEICYGTFLTCSACSKLYKRNIVTEHPFPVRKLYEDLATTYKIIGESKKIVYNSKRLYYYRRRDNSITTEKYSKDHLYIVEAAEAQLTYIKKYYPQAVKAAEARCAYSITNVMSKVLKACPKENDTFYYLREVLRKYYKILLSEKRIDTKYKIRAVSIIMGYLPAKVLYFLNDGIKFILKRKT